MERSNRGIEGACGVLVDDPGTDAQPTPAQEAAPDVTVAPTHRVHRLRDLDRHGRVVAALFALVLVAIPLIAFAKMAPIWSPQNDPALMALRSLDVGTSRTPVLGQPSTSQLYAEDDLPVVAHPGPVHFYVMAAPIRLFGATTGMLLVSLLVSSTCLLLSAWAAFRQLGPPGGVLAAVILGAITFTLGVSSLMNPVSSNFAGYPVFCSMVLLWCLLAGDLRLLPLAAAVVAFAAQQHLSSTPVLLLVTAIVGAIVARRILHQRRSETAAPPGSRRLVLGAAGIGLFLWAPVFFQQVAGRGPGNLTSLVEFTRNNDRPTIGLDMARRQMAHVLGLPPLLGRTELDGHALLEPVGVLGWASAGLVLAATVAAGVANWRKDRARAGLLVMALLLVAGGLFNGSSVPDGIEMGRLAFYHWAWPLTFFVLLGLGIAAYEWVSRLRWAAVGRMRPAVLAVALASIVVPAGVNPTLDRPSNTAFAANATLESDEQAVLVDGVLARRDELGDRTVVFQRGSFVYLGFGHGLGLSLIEEGLDVRFPPSLSTGVHPHRMADRDTLDSGLVVVVSDGVEPSPRRPPGELVATVDTSHPDADAFTEVVQAFEEADEVVLGDELEHAIATLPTEAETRMAQAGFELLEDNPREALRGNPLVLDLLRDHPPEQPRIDTDTVDRLMRSYQAMAEEDDTATGFLVQVYLLDREELLGFARDNEIGR